MGEYKYISYLDDIRKENQDISGGFRISANAYLEFIYDNEIDEYIRKMIYGLDEEDSESLENISQIIKKRIMECEMPHRLIGEIKEAYREFSEKLDIKNPQVSLRHSGIQVDLSRDSILGQDDGYLDIRGEDSLIDHIKKSWACLWKPEAIYHREKHDLDHFYISLSLSVESMLNPSSSNSEMARPLKVLTMGVIASPGIGRGKVRNIKDISQIDLVEKGDVIVTAMTNIDMIAAMKIANSIVTEQGGTTSHAAIVSRELQIPCIVSASDALNILEDGMEVTVDASKGIVYKGYVDVKI